MTHTSYNIISYTQSETEQQAADGESHEPMFVDPGAEENGIYSCTLSSQDYSYACTWHKAGHWLLGMRRFCRKLLE